MATNTMQWKVIIAKHTNKQNLTFQNHPDVVSNDFPLVKIFHKILQDLTRFHKFLFQNLANCKIP